MCRRRTSRMMQIQPDVIALCQLPAKVSPFVLKLSLSLRDPLCTRRAKNARGIEVVSPACGLGMDRAQIAADSRQGIGRIAEPSNLWVVTVPARLASEHCLCKQRFAPERDKPSRIQMFR